jgi:hypothetical protein
MANSTAKPVANQNTASSSQPLPMKMFTSASVTLSPADHLFESTLNLKNSPELPGYFYLMHTFQSFISLLKLMIDLLI